MNPMPGLLWYKPLQQTFTQAAQHARRRYTEREKGSEPGAILLNPCHQSEFLPPRPPGEGRGEGSQLALPLTLTTLAGLPIRFDAEVRPNHLLVITGDDQKNSQRAAQDALATRTPAQEGTQ